MCVNYLSLYEQMVECWHRVGSTGTSIVASFVDWLSIDMPRNAYEGDQVVVRCSGEDNSKIKKLMYYKDGSRIATYHSHSGYTISNARSSDSGSYNCKADRTLFLFVDVTEESRSIRLTVRGESLTIQMKKTWKE